MKVAVALCLFAFLLDICQSIEYSYEDVKKLMVELDKGGCSKEKTADQRNKFNECLMTQKSKYPASAAAALNGKCKDLLPADKSMVTYDENTAIPTMCELTPSAPSEQEAKLVTCIVNENGVKPNSEIYKPCQGGSK